MWFLQQWALRHQSCVSGVIFDKCEHEKQQPRPILSAKSDLFPQLWLQKPFLIFCSYLLHWLSVSCVLFLRFVCVLLVIPQVIFSVLSLQACVQQMSVNSKMSLVTSARACRDHPSLKRHSIVSHPSIGSTPYTCALLLPSICSSAFNVFFKSDSTYMTRSPSILSVVIIPTWHFVWAKFDTDVCIWNT